MGLILEAETLRENYVILGIRLLARSDGRRGEEEEIFLQNFEILAPDSYSECSEEENEPHFP